MAIHAAQVVPSSFEVNRWVVSGHEFIEHASAEHAKQECCRLHLLFPKKLFRIYKITTILIPAGTVVAMPVGEADEKCNACGALQN